MTDGLPRRVSILPSTPHRSGAQAFEGQDSRLDTVRSDAGISSSSGEQGGIARSLFIFELFRDAMRAEYVLKKAGFDIKSGAPPPEVRTGCDLGISVPSQDVKSAERALLDDGIPILDVVFTFEEELPPLQISKLVKKVDYGNYLMIRVGNMKLTFEKKTGVIVNISGGGCPDIPLLALKMVGQSLDKAPQPNDVGFTLCAYTLQKAYESALEARGKKH